MQKQDFLFKDDNLPQKIKLAKKIEILNLLNRKAYNSFHENKQEQMRFRLVIQVCKN